MGFNWIPQERWGTAYKDNTNTWMDPKCVEVESDQKSPLHLRTKYNPQFIHEWDQLRPIAIGLVSCVHHFSYGRFIIEAKLPDVPFAWPAFWLYSWKGWPPEIDFFEGYANSRGSYFQPTFPNLCQFWKMETNLHLPLAGEPYALGAKRLGGIGCRDPRDHFITYEGRWHPDDISIWVDGKLAHRWDIPRQTLNQFKPPMNLLINTGVQSGKHIPPDQADSDFVIKSFKYIPL